MSKDQVTESDLGLTDEYAVGKFSWEIQQDQCEEIGRLKRQLSLQSDCVDAETLRQQFESFFQSQPFYLQQKYIHGDRLFDFDEGIGYRNLSVQIGYVCFCKDDREFVLND